MVRPSAFWSGLARRSSDASAVSTIDSSSSVEAGAGLGRDVDEHGVAAVLLRHESVLGELAAGLARVGVGLVDLVHGDHDRHTGGLGVVERLDRLRHDAVVGRDHQHRDVGGLRTTGTHGGERLVTRGVDEGDATLGAVDLRGDLVGTDGLRDATGLLVDDVAVAQGVEQLRLAVVDVTHDGDDRRTRGEILLDAFVLAELEAERLQQLAVLFLRRDDLDVVVQLLAEDLQDVVVDRLRGGDHLTEVEQHLHQRCGVGADLVGEVAQRGATGQPDRLALALADADAADGGRLHLVEFLALGALALATTSGRAAGATEGALRAAATAAAGTAGTTAGAAEAATGTSAAGAAEAATAAAAARDGRRRPVRRGRRRGPPGGHWDDHRDHPDHPDGRRVVRRGRTAWASSPGWGAACRDVPGAPPSGAAGGRGARSCCMPWRDENGLLPGRAPPGRGPGRGLVGGAGLIGRAA